LPVLLGLLALCAQEASAGGGVDGGTAVAASCGPGAPCERQVTPPVATSAAPWRLTDAPAVPPWLELTLEQRTRYERFDGEFRVAPFADQLFALRTRAAATIHMGPFRLGGELQDSRQYAAPEEQLLSTAVVNAADLLQGYLGYQARNVFRGGDTLDVQVGRHTMNIGSRRLVARNRFRNTTNAFTGINATWHAGATDLRAFLVAPVLRLPRDPASLRDNVIELDEADEGTRFFGVHGATGLGALAGEAYVLRLDESDSENVLTRNRELWTVGARLRREPAPGRFDVEWESAYQVGRSRSTSSELDIRDLDHRAWFHHLSIGYRFRGRAEPRVEMLFDYASGDRDPDDDENNRFDTLFGARRFELGPTGIYGAFARSNIVSPGLRFTWRAGRRTRLMAAHRAYYLASARDFWTTSGLVDPTGSAGRYVGQQAEVRVRHDLVPGNLRIEFGVAHRLAGSFVEDAPNNTGQAGSTYGYLMTTLSF
jgi:hypothetical protein